MAGTTATNFHKNSLQILIETNSIRFPLKLTPILDYFGIKAVTDDGGNLGIADVEAQCFALEGDYYIVTKPIANKHWLRLNIAHELGHIVLGHLEQKGETESIALQEMQADIFALRLLMPAIVCQYENLTTPQRIADFFDVSLEAATVRAECLDELYDHDRFLTTPFERKYLDTYKYKNN